MEDNTKSRWPLLRRGMIRVRTKLKVRFKQPSRRRPRAKKRKKKLRTDQNYLPATIFITRIRSPCPPAPVCNPSSMGLRIVSAPVKDFVSARGAQLLKHVQAVLVMPGLLPVALAVDPPENFQPFRARHLTQEHHQRAWDHRVPSGVRVEIFFLIKNYSRCSSAREDGPRLVRGE